MHPLSAGNQIFGASEAVKPATDNQSLTAILSNPDSGPPDPGNENAGPVGDWVGEKRMQKFTRAIATTNPASDARLNSRLPRVSAAAERDRLARERLGLPQRWRAS